MIFPKINLTSDGYNKLITFYQDHYNDPHATEHEWAAMESQWYDDVVLAGQTELEIDASECTKGVTKRLKLIEREDYLPMIYAETLTTTINHKKKMADMVVKLSEDGLVTVRIMLFLDRTSNMFRLEAIKYDANFRSDSPEGAKLLNMDYIEGKRISKEGFKEMLETYAKKIVYRLSELTHE